MSADRGGSNGEVPVALLPPAARFNRSGKLIGCSGVYQNTPRVSKVRSISDPIRFTSSLRCGGTAVWGGESVLSPSSMFSPFYFLHFCERPTMGVIIFTFDNYRFVVCSSTLLAVFRFSVFSETRATRLRPKRKESTVSCQTRVSPVFREHL